MEEILKQLINKYFEEAKQKKLDISIGTVATIGMFDLKLETDETVRLVAIDEAQDYCLIYPKIGSKVIVGRLENTDELFLIQCSEVEKVIVKMGLLKFEMIDNKFKIESGGANLKSILNQVLQQLQVLVITTPAGPGSLSPADVAVFSQSNTLINQLLM
jgi:hypothetical protein